VALAASAASRPVLVNFGGDLAVSGPRTGARPWQVGIADDLSLDHLAADGIALTRGGLATSGDTRRFVIVGGRRLGHILDPRTGWPVEGAPRSVTVVAGTCLEAGTLSTLAVLHGPGAAEFLREQGVLHRLSA
jgi:thiamine biosynthesis lipoprotein